MPGSLSHTTRYPQALGQVKIPSGPFTLSEQNIYGSSREGVIKQNKRLDTATIASTVIYNLIGDKQYQHANHLGNVLATVSDVPVADNGGSGSVTLRYKPDYLSGNAYSSFGAPLAETDWNWMDLGAEYRYGFNGKEKDDDIKNTGNSYDFGARIYDPRLGRWLKRDPLEYNYPYQSPYCGMDSNPIQVADPTEICEGGLENCVDAYLSYLTKMGINDSTDAGYILLADFCQGGYFSYSEVYANFIDSVFTGAFDTTSFKWTYLWEFAGGSYSSACRKDYVIYVSSGSPTLSLAEFCSGYTPTEPCRAPWASDPPQWPTISQPEINCSDYAQAVAHATAQQQYDAYIEALKDQFRQRYIDACIKNAVETFTMEYPETEYHHTLYYYDQAGNLTRTVPPQGVTVVTGSGDLAQIKSDRVNKTQVFKTQHAFTTTYTYNSLNQLVKQNTPDGGTGVFWYDHLGRIVVSQNAQQALGNLYSYTVYDGLGRVTEAGQAYNTTAMTDATAKNVSSLNSWIVAANLTEITRSYYDEVKTALFNPSPNPFPNGQQNLRKRIAHVAFFTTESNMNSNVYQSATHYSYDIHGNVKELVQDMPILHALLSGNRYKLISYDFDLISGNVHQVKYQEGKVDQYFHKYRYDSDNRITHVYTSTDNMHWDRDAKYFYYKHGPLARKELGHHKVQGEDYAYTIQGWIKGVNSNSLNEQRDMGQDGYNNSGNLNKFVGKDAFGYSLHYFSNDYIAKAKSNGGYSATNFFIAQTSGATYLSSDAPDLYNGNIRHMVTTVRKDDLASHAPEAMLTAYRYDQLNRIKQMKMYRDLNFSTNAWGNGSGYNSTFEEKYVYDHNGNILRQVRNGNSTTINMDNLTYIYYKQDGTTYNPVTAATPSNATNRLAYVEDAVSSGNYSTDIDGQSSGNYTYDAIGQLTSDAQEEIGSITWSVTGKVRKVVRTAPSTKGDLEFFYGPMGQRFAKVSKPDGTSIENGGTNQQAQWTYTIYVMDASGNVMATYHWVPSGPLTLDEQMIYGSSREGVINRGLNLSTATLPTTTFSNLIGDKQYQHSNHLGNVLATVSDVPIADNGGSGSTLVAWNAYYLSAHTYSSFGAKLADGVTNWGYGYRYGFNGQEKDDELKGDGNSCDFEFRMHDTRLGRFFSVDKFRNDYPWYSPYQFAGNKPIIAIDLEGLEEYIVIRWVENGKTKATSVLKADSDFKIEAAKDFKVLTITMDYKLLSKYLSKDKNGNMLLNYTGLFRGVFVEYGSKKPEFLKAMQEGIESGNGKSGFEGDVQIWMDKGFKNYDKVNRTNKELAANTIGGIVVVIEPTPQNVTFEVNSAKLTPQGEQELDLLFFKMVLDPDSKWELVGHTSTEGSAESNQKLSLARAKAAKEYLVKKGIEESRITVSGKGETQVLEEEKGTNEEIQKARSRNRRIEMKKVN